jgi:L-serine dehydratase
VHVSEHPERAHTSIPPSILNDVIGPVMRGPSSSHCAAALRIGRLARDLAGGDLVTVQVTFDTRSSLATTHRSQGSDMGLCGGLLGWEVTDPRLAGSVAALRAAGVRLAIDVAQLDDAHPNAYHLELEGAAGHHRLTALSTGGGAILVTDIDGAPVAIRGDAFETLFYAGSASRALVSWLDDALGAGAVALCEATRTSFARARTPVALPQALIESARVAFDVQAIRTLDPVLPVLTPPDLRVPFLSCAQMLAHDAGRGRPLWELALDYECARGALPRDRALELMRERLDVMQRAIRAGMAGTDYADRILGPQAGAYEARRSEGRLLDAGVLNDIVAAVTAAMEAKSAMEVIVAAPTAGACGALPGACLSAARVLDVPLEHTVRALFAAGIVGVFIADRATLAAEVGGCQAECGAASGMTAAALVSLAQGTTAQALAAASMALQNTLGLICDPVANRVEVPCLGKNVLAASNALSCANMALAGYDPVIPLDEVIDAMAHVGQSLPRELRCTALGGLSVTPTSRAIERRLAGGRPEEGT